MFRTISKTITYRSRLDLQIIATIAIASQEATGDDRIFPSHPSPILRAPRDHISRKGTPSLRPQANVARGFIQILPQLRNDQYPPINKTTKRTFPEITNSQRPISTHKQNTNQAYTYYIHIHPHSYLLQPSSRFFIYIYIYI